MANGGECITEEIKKLNEVTSMKNGEKKEMVLSKGLNYQGGIIPADTPIKGYKSFNEVQKQEAKSSNKIALDILFFEKSVLLMQNSFNNMRRVEAFTINQKGLQGIAEIMRPIQKDFNEDLKLGEKYSNNVIQKLNTSINFKVNVQHEQLISLTTIQKLKVPTKRLPRQKISGQYPLGQSLWRIILENQANKTPQTSRFPVRLPP
jgi:hypothetical protein